MANALRDQNHVDVVLGYDEAGDTTDMARCDPATKYILIEIQPRPDYSGVQPREPAERDQNHVTDMMGIRDRFETTIGQIVANPTSKLPMVDVLEI